MIDIHELNLPLYYTLERAFEAQLGRKATQEEFDQAVKEINELIKNRK